MEYQDLKKAFDHPIFPCPRCGNRALGLRQNVPRASFQCSDCEAFFHGLEPFPAGDLKGSFRIESARARGGKTILLELADHRMASDLFPGDFTESRLRRRCRREKIMRIGCLLFLLGLGGVLLILIIQFYVGVL